MINKILSHLLRNRHLIYALFIVITLTILALTLIPSRHFGSSRLFEFDKIGHFLMFFSWTMAFGLLSFSKKGRKTNLVIVFFAGAIFGIFVEITQGLMPFGRSVDLYDAFADIIGSTTATFLLSWIKSRYLINK